MTWDLCIYLAIRGDFCQSLAVVTFQLKTWRSALISPPHSSESSQKVLSLERDLYFRFHWLQKSFQLHLALLTNFLLKGRDKVPGSQDTLSSSTKATSRAQDYISHKLQGNWDSFMNYLLKCIFLVRTFKCWPLESSPTQWIEIIINGSMHLSYH